jgi:hypothetical protein
MRIPALAVVALVLVAGCSHGATSRPQPSPTRAAPTPTTSTTPPTTTTPTTKPPPGPPAAGAPIADVIAWIQAGVPADAAPYHSVTRDGTPTPLQNNDVAFTTPAAKTTCMTDSTFSNGDLACLLQLTNPPPRPQAIEGQWVPGWIEFDGMTVTVGSVHGDPGRFVYGDGPQLPYGKSLRFGDYQCRSDPTGLFCVNYAHQSAAWISDAGVAPFGCLEKIAPPPDIGEKFSC